MWSTAPSCHCWEQAALVHHAESVATARGRAPPEGTWRGRIFLLFCSLSTVFSFYHFHSSPHLFLPFSSSSLLDHELPHGSYQSQWVQPLTFEAPNPDASCAVSQTGIISSPPRLVPNLCTSFPPQLFPHQSPEWPSCLGGVRFGNCQQMSMVTEDSLWLDHWSKALQMPEFDARSASPLWVHTVPLSVQLCLDSSSPLPSWHLCSHHPLCSASSTCSESKHAQSQMTFIVIGYLCPSFPVSLWHREQILFRFSLVQEIL